MKIHVECYAGHEGEETPQGLRFDNRPVEVIDVIDRWVAPGHRYFKLKGEDGASCTRPRRRRPDGVPLT
jgi:hypothetical protein